MINDNGGTKSAGDFTLSVTGSSPSPASFSGSETGTTVTLNAGSYSVDESALSGYTKSIGADCSGTIANGETKTCTITNDDQAATLIVKKHVINDNGGTKAASDFTMNVTGTNVQPSTSFPGSETGTTVTLNAGSYSVDESAMSGYTKSIGTNCSGTIANGETKTCTITNDDQPPGLTLVKTVSNTHGGQATIASFQASIDGTPVAWNTNVTVAAGAHTASETSVSGYTSGTGWSGDCAANGAVAIGLGEHKTCYITNSDIPPTLKVCKAVLPSGDGGKFNLQIDGATQLADAGDGQCTNAVPVLAGIVHTVGEVDGSSRVSDYVQSVSAPCASDGKITLGLAQNATCTITNTRKGKVQVIKTVNVNGSPGDPSGFTFRLRQGASTTALGTVLESLTTGPTGILNFTTMLTPGNTYNMCEVVDHPGWATNLPAPYALYNPNGNNVAELCSNFTVSPGGLKVFTVNNFVPSSNGLASTIGFWKNWASCSGSNGKQAPVLDQTLVVSESLTTPPFGPGITIGNLTIHAGDCAKAVSILDKRTLDGKKMASDPGFNLAAQLLAAILNIDKGAGVCPNDLTVITRAEALLVKYNFNGTITGYPSTKITAADANLMNALAALLDSYNNNGPCPATVPPLPQ